MLQFRYQKNEPRQYLPQKAYAIAALLLLSFVITSVRAASPTPPPISGKTLSEPGSIAPADVLARVNLVRDHVEVIRAYMGKTAPPEPMLSVTSARPPEVYSQALNMEQRANRLAFEQARVAQNRSLLMTENIQPSDVYKVVDGVLADILLVREVLDIHTAVAEKLQPESTTPTDVFNASVKAGAEINNLLEQRTSPSDVFQLVTAAVHTAAALHTSIPNGNTLPDEPDFEPNIRPDQVLLRLRSCFDLISRLASSRGIKLLTLNAVNEQMREATPNDVSDMASMLVEQLNEIHRGFDDARQPARAYYPGKRFPAHVYQRAGLLEAVLQDLVDAYAPAESTTAP